MLFLRMGLMFILKRNVNYNMISCAMELISLLLRSYVIFSMYSSFALRMDAVNELRFVLNCAQICSLFDFFARLKSRFHCIIYLLMFELIHGGSFGLTVISLYEIDFFAASMIML